MLKSSKGASVMVLHERQPRTVLLWSDNSQALPRAIAPPLQVDHGDSSILSESMSLLSGRLLSAMYRRVQFLERVSVQSAVPIPRLISCSWQEVSDLSPDSAWDGLQLYSPATSQRGDPSLKTIHPKSMQQMLAAMQERLQWWTTSQKDVVYLVLCIFSIYLSAIYGEKKHSALRRLLQEIMAGSGDITALDWVGKSPDFNSCLPEDITSHKAAPVVCLSLSTDEMILPAIYDPALKTIHPKSTQQMLAASVCHIESRLSDC
ncbi:hypothetical protein BDR03DRAFT_302920 [Suillus americanus]|nr:hypothetical protein BDR03DRAFT_302920 [Suillus americanus]